MSETVSDKRTHQSRLALRNEFEKTNGDTYTQAMWQRAIAIFLLLWLPLQAWAAVVMPFCQHAKHREAISAVKVEGATGQAGEHRRACASSHDSQLAKFSCNNWGACHLACAPAVVSAVSLPTIAAMAVEPDTAKHFLSLFDPEQRKRPPLA